MKDKFVKITLSVAAAIAVFLLGLSFGTLPVQAPTVNQGVAQQTVNLLLDDGAKITGYQNQVIPESEPTVLGLLKQVAGEKKLMLSVDNSSSMGVFVKQIGEQKNGTAGKYWQFWVNGAQPMVAADRYSLKGSETVLWTFRKSAY